MFSQQQPQPQQQQQEYMDNPEHMFINRQQRLMNPQQHQHFHMQQHHQNSFSPMAINPSTTQSTNILADPASNPSWFGTSMDSNASSFGQSPPVYGRDLLVTPSNSTGHLMENYGDDDELSQRK
jgi:hypothetical protein